MNVPLRDLQPSLIWAKLTAWMQQNADMEAPGFQNGALKLVIYRTDKPGAWIMRNPKLYWQENLAGDSFSNCDQNELRDNADSIGEIVLLNFPQYKGQSFLGNSFEEFLAKITGPRPVGRPTLSPGEQSIQIQFKLPQSVADALGEDKNARAKEIVLEFLKK